MQQCRWLCVPHWRRAYLHSWVYWHYCEPASALCAYGVKGLVSIFYLNEGHCVLPNCRRKEWHCLLNVLCTLREVDREQESYFKAQIFHPLCLPVWATLLLATSEETEELQFPLGILMSGFPDPKCL